MSVDYITELAAAAFVRGAVGNIRPWSECEKYCAAVDRLAKLESENAELAEKVKRTRGSCNKLAKLLRDSERFIKNPSDKYATLAREHLLKAIDAALQPKEPTK